MERIYLDQAATSWPKLSAATSAAEKFIHECGATSGRGAYASARQADRWVTEARHSLAQLLGARDAADVAFCSSGTHALNATISGLVRPGYKVLTTAIEHNSVLRPLEHWRTRYGVHVVVAECDKYGLVSSPIAQQEPAPNLIILSHGSNVTGCIQDLSNWSALARQYGALLVVDASQSVGYVPIDIQTQGIDILVSAGHKGLGALSGTGFVIAQPEIQNMFEPLMWGGTGTASEQLHFQPSWPQSIEVGNLNLPAIVSMAVAAKHWLSEPQKIESWRPVLSQLVSELRENVSPDQVSVIGHQTNDGYLPVVSLLPASWDIHEAAAVLDASFGIETRAGYHCAALIHDHIGSKERGGTLRMSLGHNTTIEEVELAVQALGAMFGCR